MTTLDLPIEQLAREIHGATALFRAHQLDFGRGDGRTLRQAAQAKHLNPQLIAQELDRLSRQGTAPACAVDELPDTALIEFILSRYHDLHRQQLPELIRLAARVELVHGGHEHCPAGLTRLLENMQQELEEHMRLEEQILFPMIARGMKTAAAHPVAVMRRDHADYGQLIPALMDLTHQLQAPVDACVTWQTLYDGLRTLCTALIEHITLENDILYGRIDAHLEAMKNG